MARKITCPKIEYEQIQSKYSADRIREAYFLLFEEMARLGKLKDIINTPCMTSTLSTKQANNI